MPYKPTRPTRVLMLVENNPYPFDGRVRSEAESLASAGYRVTVVCPRESGQPHYEVIADVRVYRFVAVAEGHGLVGYAREYLYATLWLLVYYVYLLLRHGFDIVHVYNPPDTVGIIGLLTKLLGKKFVYDHRDPSPDLYASKFDSDSGLIYATLIWLEHLCCRHAHLVIAPNEYCRDLEITRHHVPAHNIAVVYNGPKLDRFVPRPPAPIVRNRAPNIIAFLGHISSQDGVDHLLRALYHLRFDLGREDFFCIIVGPSDDEDALRRQLDALDLAGYVWLTGKIPFGETLLAYLSAADICVEPAPSSPLNNIATFVKVMEYMALGKPIVAYDLPGNRFLADASALYARVNDPADFADKLAGLMDAPTMRQAMGCQGQRRVRDRFAWEKSAETLLHAYQRLTVDGPLDRPARTIRSVHEVE
ncbi:MAG: glycosyltransferase family 4 protein [Anaerolineae bacterium]